MSELDYLCAMLIDDGPVSKAWNLVLDEDFTTGLNHDLWSRSYNAPSNSNVFLIPENASIDSGVLRLKATDTAYGGKPYTGGEISTKFKFHFRHGYFAARMKIPSGKGLWSAFWAFGVDPWEVDVFELLGKKPEEIILTYHHWLNGHRQIGKRWTGPDFSQDWHIYSVLWEPDEIVWYVDGAPHHRVTRHECDIYDDYLYLFLSLFVGGSYPGEPDGSTPFPSYVDIDWVKVWQRDVDYITPGIRNATFDAGPVGSSGFDRLVGADALAVTSKAAMGGSDYGSIVTIEDQQPHYGIIDALGRYMGKYLTVEFDIDPNSLVMATDDIFQILRVHSAFGGGWQPAVVNLAYDGSTYQLIFYGNDDSLTWGRAATVDVTDAPHNVRIEIERAESDTSSDGEMRFYVDDVLEGSWSDEDNYDLCSNLVWIDVGAVNNVDAGTNGAFYLDNISAVTVP